VDHAKEVAILDAARELMFTKGPAKLSMEAVARKAGVSKVTLYNRFSNKNVLIEALIRRQSNELIKHLGITPEARISPRQALYKFGQRLLSFILSQDNLNFLRLLGSVPEADRDLLQGIYDYGVQASQLALSQWLSSGLFAAWQTLQLTVPTKLTGVPLRQCWRCDGRQDTHYIP